MAAFNAKSEDLGAMVDFLYSGKAIIHQENFDSVMTLAKDLQLNGLWGDFLNDDDISYSDVENETREKNQISSYSPLKNILQCQTRQRFAIELPGWTREGQFA